jgi:hypothetical protein
MTDATQIYHVNAISNEGIYECFEDFAWRVLEDKQYNKRKEAGDVGEDLWDESIYVKQR